MDAQRVLSLTIVTEYEKGCFALESEKENYYIDIAINEQDELVEFEVYVNDKAVELPESEKEILVKYLRDYALSSEQQEERNEPFQPDMMDLAKELKLERIA